MKNDTYTRVNITLPSRTLRRIDHATARGERSHLIDDAVTRYLDTHSRASIEKLLKEGAEGRAERDRALAEDWFSLDDAWPTKRQ